MYKSKYTGKQVDDILAKAEAIEIPTKTSELENDSGYVTSDELSTAIRESIINELNSDV